MTLILAIGCTNGVVVAADSASTDSEVGTKQPTSAKIGRMAGVPVLCGSFGDVGLSQKVRENLDGVKPQPNLKRLRQEIKRAVLPELDDARKEHIPYPQQGFSVPPAVIFLFAGIHDGKPFILEIERDGRDTMYDESLGLFAAIGSGKPWAQAVFRPHLLSPRDLRLGTILAHRVLEDSIEIASGGLALPIHIYTISVDGKESKIDDATLPDTCETWRELEREAVGKLLARADGSDEDNPEEVAEIPTPS